MSPRESPQELKPLRAVVGIAGAGLRARAALAMLRHMALEHASPLQPIALQPDGTLPPDAVSVSLIKSAELQLLRVVLRAGGTLPAHWVAGECTIQCLSGRAELRTPDKQLLLAAGEVVLVPAHVPHELQAGEDSALLVTIRLGT